MKPMTNLEWSDVVTLYKDLWADAAAKMTPAEWNIWRAKLGSFPVQWVKDAIGSHYGTGKFPAKLREVAAACWDRQREHQASPEAAAAKQAALDREDEECKAQWRELETVIAGMSSDDLRGHAIRIVAAQPSVAPYLGLAKPRQSKGLWAQVAERLRAGMGPFEDFAPVRVQPTGKLTKFMPVHKWPVSIVPLTKEQIATAAETVARLRKTSPPVHPVEALAAALPSVPEAPCELAALEAKHGAPA